MRPRSTTAVVVALTLALAGCGGDDEEAPPDEAGPAAGEEPADEPESAPEPEQEVYEVRAGDTLWDIAERFDVTVDELVEANGLDDPDVLAEGQELVIP